MERVYNLIGKAMEQFQNFECMLRLLGYEIKVSEGKSQEALSLFGLKPNATLGNIISKLKENKILTNEEEIIVFEYIKSERNDIAHNFFIDNTFKTEEDINKAIEELSQIIKDTKFITNVLARQISDIKKQN